MSADRRMHMQILYPLFVYTYLDLVKRSQGGRARELLRRLRPRFVDAAGATAALASELDDLATAVYPQHLQNRVPKQVRI